MQGSSPDIEALSLGDNRPGRSLVAAVDRMAAKSSLQGELRWEFCVPITVPSGDGLLQLPLTFWIPAPAKLMAAAAAVFTATAALFMELDPVMLPPGPDPLVECGKYPPGEGRPSGPRPGLRLRSNVGGLHLELKRLRGRLEVVRCSLESGIAI